MIVQKIIIKEILKLLTKQFKLDKLVKYVVEPNELDEKVESLVDGLTYEFGRTLGEYSRWADDSKLTIQDMEEMPEAHKEVLKDTDGAISIACSGPTTVAAATTLNKLYFKFQDPTCKSNKLI